MIETKTRKRLMILILLAAFIASLAVVTPLYARPTFGNDCLSCHNQGGVTMSSNVTSTIDANASSHFGMEVLASGDAAGLTMIWSSFAGNPNFGFTPSSIVDNDPNDLDPQTGSIKGHFAVTAAANQGSYTLQVFAAGAGAKGGTLTFQVAVAAEQGGPSGNLLPTANFLYSRVGMTISFEDRSVDPEGNITAWLWNFGDNATSTQQNPTHTFAQPGTYAVTLTVTDGAGATSTYSQQYTLPTLEERQLLWTTQVAIGSAMIIFTVVFAAGIAARRKKVETKKP